MQKENLTEYKRRNGRIEREYLRKREKERDWEKEREARLNEGYGWWKKKRDKICNSVIGTVI